MKYQEWRKILLKGIGGTLTYKQHKDMMHDSADWNCCAVGAKLMCDLGVDKLKTANNVAIELINDRVWELGNYGFPYAIGDKNYDKALTILDEIYNTENIYSSEKTKQEFIEAEKNE
jgi:hypothetical protein